MNQNRRQTTNGTWVVHEGLQNNPDIKRQLEEIVNEINEVTSNERRHLSDSAIILGSISEKLESIANELVHRHGIEKKEGVKQTK